MRRVILLLLLSFFGISSLVSAQVVAQGQPGDTPWLVNCSVGCSASGQTDNSSFTIGSTVFGPSGGVYKDAATALADGVAAAFRITSRRALHVNLRDNNGAEISFPALVSGRWPVDGSSVTQPVSVVSPLDISTGGVAIAGPVAQGTATATLSNGWAIVHGYGSASTTTWNSASALDAFVASTSTGQYPTVTVSLIPTGSVTGGTINFDESIDGGSNLFPVACSRTDGSAVPESSFAFGGAASKLWVCPIAGANFFRARLNPALTGTGSVAIRVELSAAAVAPRVPVVAGFLSSSPLPAGSNAIGKLAANSGVIIGDVNVVSDIPGTGATNFGKAEDAAHTSGDVGVLTLATRNDTATQTTNADRDYSALSVDAYSDLFVRRDHPNRIRCTVAVSTATVLTAFGGSCAAPGAGLSLYITDISSSANVGAIAADSFNTLKYGTGGACGTGTTIFWLALYAAAAQVTVFHSFATPLKIPANNEICWINSTAGTKAFVVLGFIAP